MAHEGQNLWSQATLKLSRPYLVLTLSFNIITSTLLVLRLLYMRKEVLAHIGPDHATAYTTAAAIITESMLPVSIFSSVLVLLYGLQDGAENLLINILLHVEVSPQKPYLCMHNRTKLLVLTTTVCVGDSVRSDDPPCRTRKSLEAHYGFRNYVVGAIQHARNGAAHCRQPIAVYRTR